MPYTSRSVLKNLITAPGSNVSVCPDGIDGLNTTKGKLGLGVSIVVPVMLAEILMPFIPLLVPVLPVMVLFPVR